MPKYIITSTIRETVEAEDAGEAIEVFMEELGERPQETYETYLNDSLIAKRVKPQGLYRIKEKDCEHLYRDASDKRFCVDCGKEF